MPPEPAVVGLTLTRGAAPVLCTAHGRPLADALAAFRRSPSTQGLHDLLRPLVAACYQVAYAHSRGVTHLGLTPRLILLGEFGESAAVGWDRLKAVPQANGQPASSAELDAFSAAFLAPEQVAGSAETVGPASDVYALGCILYAILTGQPPYIGSTFAEVVSRVREGLAWQPRMVAARVPVALEAICLTAMERDPAHRYASAADLAREVERWMAGERVRTNYAEPKVARLARWARGRVGLSVLAALAIAVIATLGLVIYAMRRDQLQLREDVVRQNAQLEQATEGLRQGKDYVDGVNRQRQLASDELAAGIQALQALVVKAQPRSDDGPTLAAYKADLLRTVLDGARQMALRADLGGGTDLAAGQDRINLGELFRVLGQPGEARRHYERAVLIARPAARTQPDSLMAQRELIAAARGLGQVCLQEGQASLARNLASEAHSAAEAWAKTEPNNPLAKREAAICLDLMANASVALHDLAGAREAFDTMIATVEGYANAEPKNLLRRIDLANTCIGRGKVERLDYNFAEALRWYDRALGILRPLKADGQLKLLPQEAARLDELEQTAAECREVLKAIDDINVALDAPPEKALGLLLGRAAALARRGKPDEATATVEKMRQLQPQDGTNLYNVACCYALCIPAVGVGKAPDALTADEKAARAGYAARALKALRAAAEHGFRNVEKIESDSDLDALHQDAGYRAFVAELKALRIWVTFPVLP